MKVFFNPEVPLRENEILAEGWVQAVLRRCKCTEEHRPNLGELLPCCIHTWRPLSSSPLVHGSFRPQSLRALVPYVHTSHTVQLSVTEIEFRRGFVVGLGMPHRTCSELRPRLRVGVCSLP